MNIKYFSALLLLICTLQACGGSDEEKDRDAKRDASKGCDSMTQQADGACDSKPQVVGSPRNTM